MYRSGHNEAVLKTVWVKAHGGSNPSSSANKTDKPFACPFCLMHYVRGIRTRALRKRHGASFLAAARKRREKQALAFAEIERSGHRKQMDTKCQMQSISAQAQFV